MIPRPSLLGELKAALKRSRVTALLGPRQCGKSTLAQKIVSPDSPNYLDLENPEALARLSEPMTTLKGLRGIVVLDEIQRRPELFPILRVLADRRPLPARFLVLGSASSDLLRQTSESLAGRLETIAMGGFSMAEVGAGNHAKHWRRGGFPLSYLARTEADSLTWRRNFIQRFLERDMPLFGVLTPATTLLRFWTMLAHYHGQVWKASEPARSLGVSEPMVRRYLDLLEWVFMVRQVQPWHANLKKRQVKSPKVYFRDTGLLHHLLGIRDDQGLLTHPKMGASWEGYVVEEVIKSVEPDQVYFWATHQGAELDLLIFKDGRRLGVECKYVDAPIMTPSMRIALEDLRLDSLTVIYPGSQTYSLAEKVKVVPLSILAKGAGGLISA